MTSRVNANADLLWYYGTMQGDMGLSSRFGSQLQAADEGRNTSHGVNIGEIEDAMIKRCKHATRMKNIELRLAQLSRRQNLILEAHFKGRGLPFGISSAAIYCEHARVMCVTNGRPPSEKLREKLMSCKTAEHRDVKGLTWEVNRLIEDTLDEYASHEVDEAKPIQDARQGWERTAREVGKV